MKVKCINVEKSNNLITKNKIYNVIESDDISYFIENDNGCEDFFNKNRFIVVGYGQVCSYCKYNKIDEKEFCIECLDESNFKNIEEYKTQGQVFENKSIDETMQQLKEYYGAGGVGEVDYLKSLGTKINEEYLINMANYKYVNRNNMEKVFEDFLEVWEEKNKQYGATCDRMYDSFGGVYFEIMIMQKLNRVIELSKTESTFESKDDTIMDLMGYTAMYLARIRNENHIK